MTLDTSVPLAVQWGAPAAPALPVHGVIAVPVQGDAPENAPGSPYDCDAFVARYAAVWAWGLADPARTSEPYYEHLLDLALPAQAPRPASILDAGCGPGRVLGELARRAPDAAGTGIDASPVMIGVADRILRGPAGAGVRLDAGDFGFDAVLVPALGRDDLTLHTRTLAEHAATGARYDLVVASHLLDRVPSPRRSLAELAGMVAPGGRLVVSCAFNYDRRESWQLSSARHLADAVADLGLVPDTVHENVRYAERLDIRGTVTEHLVAVVAAGRPPC